MSVGLSQKIAYFNVILILVGIFLIKKHPPNLSKTNKIWFIFYILYYSIGLLSSGIHGFTSTILATFIAPIYFIGFYFLLSDPDEFKRFYKILTVIFVLASFFTIYLFIINFNFDDGAILNWKVDRAEGLYGDANNAALGSIITYVLVKNLYNPSNIIFRVFKISILLIIVYSLFLTFSTTGFFVFTVILFITNYKFFTGLRFALLGIAISLLYVGIFSLKSQTKTLDLSAAQVYKIENVINLLTFNLDQVDNSGRGDLIENILPYLYENPILGNGIDFSAAMRGHNTYIGVWVDAGVFTFLFYIFMLSFYFIKTFSLNPEQRYFTISILVALYVFMFSLQTVINQPYLIVLFVFAGYIIDYNKSEKINIFKKENSII
ncbi:hypothetical protein MWU76_06855 [Gelidibacter sp. F2691]|nr:hypothetical protein [Gelidibacter sp. F2691]